MLILAIEAQPGMPKTYKVFVDGKPVHERHTLGSALFDLLEEIDKKMYGEFGGKIHARPIGME